MNYNIVLAMLCYIYVCRILLARFFFFQLCNKGVLSNIPHERNKV